MTGIIEKSRFEPLINFVSKHRFVCYMVLIITLKHLLLMGLPIFAHPGADHDDGMMVKMAESLMNGRWLGDYTELTLVKGLFFPLFLAINGLLGISYSVSVPGFYTIACIIFVIGTKKLFKNELPLLIIFTVLMLNPISFANETFTRVYRNSLIAGQVLMIAGSLVGMYLSRFGKNKNMMIWSILAGLSVASLWHSREDGIWIIPLTLGVMLISGVTVLVKNELSQKEKIKKALIISLPIWILIFTTVLISTINYGVYGVYTTNELNDSNYTKTIKLIYSVETTDMVHNVSVPRSSMEKIYDAVPSLNAMRDEIDASMDRWSWYDKDAPVREVEDGWFFWSIREAVAKSGYYSDAQTANNFYAQVNGEFEEAFASGQLQHRTTMPSALMSPWRVEYWEELPKAFLVTLHYVTGYESLETSVLNSIDDGRNGLRLFERVTNNLALYPEEEPKWSDQIRINILNLFQSIYQLVGVFVFLLAGLGYAVMTALLFFKKARVKYNLVDFWLVLTGFLFSAFILMIGVSYTEISAYVAISYWYLAGAYPLIAAFSTISIYKISEILIENIKEKKSR